jgi:hypothetical protein
LAWGFNGEGELGNGGTTDLWRPNVIPGLGGVIEVVGGLRSGIALRADGTSAGWGWNGWGQLGDGTGITRLTPIQVWLTRALSVAAPGQGNHAAAVRDDGTLWTWGENDAGALGDGTTTTNATPKPVPAFALFFDDIDRDGLSASEEGLLGTNPNLWDTNGDGIPDGLSVRLGISPTSTDVDGDGVLNSVETAQGTDPFTADTDGDGVNDVLDCAPLDSTRSTCVGDPNDHTPPVITLDEPAGAVPIP